MARRTTSNETEVSLFPFLSILACIIGVLTLLISTLALSQMDNDVVAAVEEFEKVSVELKTKEAELADFQKKVADEKAAFAQQATQQQKKLAEAQKQMQVVQSQLILARKKRDQLDEQPEDAVTPELQPLEELEQELTGLKEQIAQLTKEIEKRNLPPEEAEVSVMPGGSGIGIKPRFVECTKNEIVLHNPDGLVRIRAGNINASEPFLKLLDEVAGDPDSKVIFLIRDDGVPVWFRARNFANSLNVENGKLPVLGHGRIDLKYFYQNN